MASAWLGALEFTHLCGEPLKNVHPCTFLSFEFAASANIVRIEPPPSVAVCGETEQAKCVVWCSKFLKIRLTRIVLAALAARKFFD